MSAKTGFTWRWLKERQRFVAKKKQIFLGILNENSVFCDGGISIGLYDGETKEQAKENMLDGICLHFKNDNGYREKKGRAITMLGLNEAPVQIIVKPTTYDDR